MVPPLAPSFFAGHGSGVAGLPAGRAGLRPRAADARQKGEAALKARQLRDMTDEELDRRMAETRQELFQLRFQTATGALENSARLRLAKREIARILTIKNERERQEIHG
jgi:large subunit ribosomal protein L29